MPESSRLHPALRRALAASVLHVPARERAPERRCPLGPDALDRALGGGLTTGACHEVFGDGADGGAGAMGFSLILALRIMADASQPLLWLREEKAQRRAALCGSGLADLGVDPARLVLGVLPDPKALLRASVDALRCAGGLGVVLLELVGNPPLLDLTASRRLALAAEASGVTLLTLRLAGAKPAPSAAQTRWSVVSAPSARLEADAPGHPAFAVTLLRQRGGPAGLDFNLEWDRDAGLFRSAPLPGARLPLSGGGSRPAAGGAGEPAGWPWRIAS